MRLFVVGIDAGVEDVFRGFDMPFLESFFRESLSVPLQEDLMNRGWAEVYTGQQAQETRAFYEYPLCDGSYTWSESFCLADIANPNVLPVWNLVNQSGYSVGIMNVPTAVPVPEVRGFFVGGGGGGRKVVDSINADHVFPPSLAAELNDIGYILDERFNSLVVEKGLRRVEDFLERLMLMTTKRVDGYLRLTERYRQDFGFLVFRSIAVVHSLFFSDIEKILKGHMGADPEYERLFRNFYRHVDGELERLFAGVNPQDVMLIADHGMVTCRKFVNINKLLVDAGFQEGSEKRNVLIDIIKKYRHLVPQSIKNALKGDKKIGELYSALVPFVATETEAFTLVKLGTMHGIYVNDAERFGGPVSNADVDHVAERICHAINENDAAKALQISARLMRKTTEGSHYEKMMPDVWLDMPDNCRPVSSGALVLENARIERKTELGDVFDAHWTGAKGKATLCYCTPGLKEHINRSKTDLTLVYDAVNSVFKSR